MGMIVHETIGMTPLTKPVDYLDEGGEKDLSISVGSHKLLPGTTPGGCMIDDVRKFQA